MKKMKRWIFLILSLPVIFHSGCNKEDRESNVNNGKTGSSGGKEAGNCSTTTISSEANATATTPPATLFDTFEPINDTFIEKGVTTAQGNQEQIQVFNHKVTGKPGYVKKSRTGYLHFDLTSLSNRNITKGTLQLEIPQTGDGNDMSSAELRDRNSGSCKYYARILKIMPYSGWDENSFTYADAQVNTVMLDHHAYEVSHMFVPAFTSNKICENDPIQLPLGATVDVDSRIVSIDITEKLKDVAGYAFSVVVTANQDDDFSFYSKEAKSSGHNAPKLVVSHEKKTPTVNTTGEFSITPTTIETGTYTRNPMTGFHDWMSTTNQGTPNFRNNSDFYKRYTWDEFETAMGVYDFSILENDIAAAAERGQKFAFRLRAMKGSGNNLPGYLQNYTLDSSSCPQYPGAPDWSNPYLINRMEALIQALAQKYDGDARISWMDIGMYGRYGEWVGGCAEQSASDHAAYLNIYTANFTKTQLVLKVESPDAIMQAMRKPANTLEQKIGLRSDSAGFNNLSFLKNRNHLITWYYSHKRWQSAPSIAEFGGLSESNLTASEMFSQAKVETQVSHTTTIGNGNTFSWSTLTDKEQEEFDQVASITGYKYRLNELRINGSLSVCGSFSVTTSWSNLGNAPTYEPWKVYLRLTNETQNHRIRLSAIELRKIMPTSNRITGKDQGVLQHDLNLKWPEQLSAGEYNIFLEIVDSRTLNSDHPDYNDQTRHFPRKNMQIHIDGWNSETRQHYLGKITLNE